MAAADAAETSGHKRHMNYNDNGMLLRWIRQPQQHI